jgi:hypothetical protein
VRRIAFDGNMGDSLFKSVVMVLPEAAAGDTAKAIADFDTVNVFMRNQPGYIASMLFTRVSGDGAYPYRDRVAVVEPRGPAARGRPARVPGAAETGADRRECRRRTCS